jgi:hypothetical protein
MLFLTRWFGVTGSDAERSTAREESDIKEITQRVHRPKVQYTADRGIHRLTNTNHSPARRDCTVRTSRLSPALTVAPLPKILPS